MNEVLKRELGTAGIAFTETTKQMISADAYRTPEFWLNVETELYCQFQDILVKHKDNHTFEEMVFYSLLMGRAAHETIEELHRFDKESEE